MILPPTVRCGLRCLASLNTGESYRLPGVTRQAAILPCGRTSTCSLANILRYTMPFFASSQSSYRGCRVIPSA